METGKTGYYLVNSFLKFSLKLNNKFHVFIKFQVLIVIALDLSLGHHLITVISTSSVSLLKYVCPGFLIQQLCCSQCCVLCSVYDSEY